MPERHLRLAALAEGYGLTDLVQLLSEFVRVRRDASHRMTILGGAGVEPWSMFLERGLAACCDRQARWLEDTFGALLTSA